jgi:hypothetical protein
MNLRQAGWGGMDLTDLARDRKRWRAFMNSVKKLQVP